MKFIAKFLLFLLICSIVFTRRHKRMKLRNRGRNSLTNSTNITSNNQTNYTDNNEIVNPSKLAIKFQSIMYQIEERIGIQDDLKELHNLLTTFQSEKDRLILI